MTQNKSQKMIPLAERMRPKVLADFVGQENLVGKNRALQNMIETGSVHSLIFWGPPGVGKTTLAQIIATELNLPFFHLSAIESGVKDIRSVIEKSRLLGKVILFIDEIHRFNKAQQDSLLGAVERGLIVLIGATTENPSFEVIGALLSRCQIYVLHSFSESELKTIVFRALKNDDWLKIQNIKIKEWTSLIRLSDGDGRRILNLLEIVAQSLSGNTRVITDENVQQIVQQKIALYDKSGEQHYDIISAFIKSIRGSDPNAAVYYLARMIEGGEDPKFIARRMVILASEDIGNANPNALLLATSCFQAVTLIGYPECRIVLAQTVTYLASSQKSNSAIVAIDKAQKLVHITGNLSVPLSIRNGSTPLMKKLDYGKGYAYAHSFEGNFIDLEFLPEKIKGERLYDPGDNPSEQRIREFLRHCWKDKYGY